MFTRSSSLPRRGLRGRLAVVDLVKFLSKRPFTVLFSGGKDSLATLLWVLDNVPNDNWNILYIEITGNTHSLCNEYVYSVVRSLGLEDKFIHEWREGLDFFKCVKEWGVPLLGIYRWCMWQFKVKVMEQYSHITQVTGIKRSDSHRRRKTKTIEVMKTGFISVNPILSWSKEDVLDYIKEHGMALNPCYSIYGHSGNCMFCPYHSKRQIVLTLQDQEWRDKILNALAYAKGKIARETAERWRRLSGQAVLLEVANRV